MGLSERFVDTVIADGWLSAPTDLLSSLRNPSGRAPGEEVLSASRALHGMSDADALMVISAIQDATYFSLLNLIDAGCKNAGVKVLLSDGSSQIDPSIDGAPLHEIYRGQVEPGGILRITS